LVVEQLALQKPNLVVFQNVFDENERYIYFGLNCVERFILFMQEHNKGFNICVAHNGSGYDTQLISEAASLLSVTPKTISNGYKFLEFKLGNTLFRDSMLHLQGSLAALAKNYNLPLLKGYFPHMFNVEENYDYSGELPHTRYFDTAFSAKTQADRDAFMEWYNERKQQPWCFKDELIKYCVNDVDILAKIMASFHNVCMERFDRSPWHHPTAPSYVHKTIVAQITKSMNLPTDPEELSTTINQLSKDYWAALVPQEYWFARQALIGGRTDARRVHYRLSEEDVAAGRRIVYQDIVSMYPYVQAQQDFLYPVGTPTIMVYDPLFYPCRKHQSGDEHNMWTRCDCILPYRTADALIRVEKYVAQPTAEYLLEHRWELFGIWCVTVIPPKNLFHPVLCVLNPKTKKREARLDIIKEGIFTSVEVVKALEKGYKLVAVHRIDKYKAKPGLWTEFIKKLYIDKMANSEPTPPQEEQDRLVAAYEARFGMGDVVRESFPHWGYNAAARLTFKIMLNSGWGKHCTRSNMPSLVHLGPDDQDEYVRLMHGASREDPELTINMLCVQGRNNILRVLAKNKDRTSHNLYLPAGLFVPAYGRLMLYDALDILQERVLYHDTDSVIYIYDPACENLPFDDIWGSWDEEKVSKNGNITAFVGLGPKSYALKTKNGKDVIKLKGLC
jgi:hypothetical protein